MRFKLFSVLLLMSFLLISSLVFAQSRNDVKDAVTAATKWLVQVDAGQYKESWKEASEYFKGAVTEQKWEESLNAVRKPLGKLISRKVRSANHKTSLPGAPDGNYVVIQFETSFENKKKAIETITPKMNNDGVWKVTGYYIK